MVVFVVGCVVIVIVLVFWMMGVEGGDFDDFVVEVYVY